MKNHKKLLGMLVLLLLFLYLLFYPTVALDGACSGLLLWYQSVLPVLFPFMLLSGAALRLDVMSVLPDPLFHLLCRIFGCSKNGCFAIVMGFFCGFPMGAKITADLAAQGKINRQEAKHLLGFVNNLSPVFLTSFLAAGQIGRTDLSALFLCSILGAAFLYGILTSPDRKHRNTTYTAKDGKSTSSATGKKIPPSKSAVDGIGESSIFRILDETIDDSVKNIVKLGAAIMVFAMLERAVAYFWKNGSLPCLLVRSCIEVTGGIRLICAGSFSLPIKYTALTALCAFGGVSSVVQTISVAKLDTDLAAYYIKSRVIITLLSLALSCFVLFFFRSRFFL